MIRIFRFAAFILAVACAPGVASGVAFAADLTESGVAGGKLVLRDTASGLQIGKFRAKHPITLPSVTASVQVEILTDAGAFLVAEGDEGGWRRHDERVWKWTAGPESELRKVILKRNRVVVLHRGALADVDEEVDFAALRLTIGDWRICARFAADDLRRSLPGRLVAKHRSSSAPADCEDATLLGACADLSPDGAGCNGTCGDGQNCGESGGACVCSGGGEPACGEAGDDDCTGTCGGGGSCEFDVDNLSGCRCVSADMPCGDTAPVCGGTCAEGLECKSSTSYPVGFCACEPPGPACGSAAFPTCGGVCNVGDSCQPVGDPLNGNYCMCRADSAPCGSGAACTAGTYCALIGSGLFGCVPLP